MAAALLAAAAAVCALELRGFPQNALLARVALPRPGFALRYTHSVTLRPIESRYEIRNGRIVQTAELFDEHGPGMATEPLAGERLERSGGRFVLSMQRPVGQMIVHVQQLPAQTLIADGDAIALTQFGERAIEIRPDCGVEPR